MSESSVATAPIADNTIAPLTAEETVSEVTAEGASVEPPATVAVVEDELEAKDEQSVEKESKETKAPSRRSTRISSKSQPEAKETPKPKRAPSTKKRAVEDGSEGAKATKKVKADPAEAGPALGSFLPEITLKSNKEVDVEVALLAKEKGVVLFLVPKADTPGCTNQACGFRDIYAEFTSAEYDVYCVSADPPAAQSKWQEKKSLPYSLLSDPERKLISALGANDKGKTKRSHFVFSKAEEDAEGKGKLVDKHIGVKPVDSPKIALEFIQSYVPVSSGTPIETSNGEANSAEHAGVTTSNGTVSSTKETVSMEESIEKPDVEAAAPATNGSEDKDVVMEAAAPIVEA
ncbi:thioredoxin-like protein [Lentinula lateritia]|uniref:thioredoxin-dependent peroxiredoxin n=1 Tax=Lentinula lateritia TaxID=40482 RepID=A0ABQ8VCB2_9AGAR|nr:thioredoxin-like protein [Lentinula lateritia]